MTTLRADDPVTVGPYRVIRRLGGGGMGQVYLAASRGGRPVAVKIVRAALADDPAFRARFRAEVAAARAVGGVFTASIVDADPDGPTPWLATEYVPGPSLQDAIEQHGPMPESTVRVLGAGLAEALRAIHGAGLIHRDLKPSNVLLAADGPRVIDFGISRALGDASLTEAGQVIGSAGYMPPEQIDGRPPTPAGDVFSLGAVLVFATTARPPFGAGPAPVLMFRTTHEPPALDGVPPGLAGPLAACLDKDPARRPPVEWLLGALSPAARPPYWLPDPVAQDLRRRETTVVDELRAPRRAITRRRVLAAGAGLGAAAAITGGALWALRGDSGPGLPRPLWQTTLPAADMYSLTETVLDGGVYFGDDDAVIALDADTGRKRWAGLPGGYGAPPAIDPSTGTCLLLIDQRIHGLDVRSGAERWARDTPAELRSAKKSREEFFWQGRPGYYLQSYDPAGLYAFDPRQGTPRWSFADPQGTDLSVERQVGDSLICSRGLSSRRIRCLDPASGGLRWTLPDNVGQTYFDPWGISDADLFFAIDEGENLFAVRARDGAVPWRVSASAITTKGEQYHYPTIQRTGGSLLLSGSHYLRLFDAATGRQAWACRTTAEDASPDIFQGGAYHLDAGVVHRVDLRTGRTAAVTGRLPASSYLESVTDGLLITSVVDASGGTAGLYAWDRRSGRQVWHHPATTANTSALWRVETLGKYLFARYEQTLLAFRLS
ncbi:hypothetical protein GCM10023195_16670 [Actinoallomurus liliacearum]|uniref:Protein kinase domain-containing protein n=1 Tax=Actinoallomurus liliacearum TaxID=1080073 RepID=A0ABP8TF19_9ACTN